MKIINNINEIISEKEFGIINPARAKLMLNNLVIDVTYQCDLKCKNCNRLCGILPRKNEVNLNQIEQIVSDSIKLNKKWNRIIVAGGEPSLFSKINELYYILQEYSIYHNKVFDSQKLQIIHATNGLSKSTKMKIKSLPSVVTHVYNSEKNNSEPYFQAMTVAPIDLGVYKEGELKVCSESWNCGICFNYRGFYPCAESASINDALISEDLSIKSLAQVNFESMSKILHKTCRYCGYYFESYGYKKSNELLISKTWNKLLNNSYQ